MFKPDSNIKQIETSGNKLMPHFHSKKFILSAEIIMTATQTDHTFVILAYKESEYLEKCVRSVMLQKLPGKVFIATSTPNAHIDSIAKKYALEIRINANTGSIGKDWNFGYESADTKYVTIAHQDDEYLPDYALKCVTAAQKHTAAKPLIVFNTSINYIGDRKLLISYKNILRWILVFPFHFKRCIQSKSIKKSILLFSNSISCPGVFFVKENLADFRFEETSGYILDWNAWYDMSQMNGSFIYVPDALHLRREHGGSATSSLQLPTLQQEELTLLKKIWNGSVIPRLIVWLLQFSK